MKKNQELVKKITILALLILAFASFSSSATIVTTNYAQYGAEIVSNTGEVSIIPKGVNPISSTKAAANGTMANPAQKSYMEGGVTKGHWGYIVRVGAITGQTQASKAYKVTLIINGTNVKTAWVLSDSNPTTGENCDVYFDLGVTNLGDEQSFMITVEGPY